MFDIFKGGALNHVEADDEQVCVWVGQPEGFLLRQTQVLLPVDSWQEWTVLQKRIYKSYVNQNNCLYRKDPGWKYWKIDIFSNLRAQVLKHLLTRSVPYLDLFYLEILI